jgi:tryptophanyl-tRNA synthetase
MRVPARDRRAGYAWEPGCVRQVPADGNERTKAIASVTLGEVRAGVGTCY